MHDESMAAGSFYHDLYISQFCHEAALASDDDKAPAEIKGMCLAGGRGAPDSSGYRVSFLAFYSDLHVWFWRKMRHDIWGNGPTGQVLSSRMPLSAPRDLTKRLG
jgi:hypothetical protein